MGLVRGNQEDSFLSITALNFPWVSPILNTQFGMFEDDLAVFYPNSERFKESREFSEERDRAQQECNQAFAKLHELGIDPNQL